MTTTEPALALPVLSRHAIAHIPDMTVNPRIFEKRFAAGCSMTQCDATCCHGGVYADPLERNRILDHAALTFNRPGGPASLVDGQPARVVKELLANVSAT